MSKERYKLIAEVYLLLIQNGKILLSRRANTGYEDGNYGLVAGHLEPNETITAALVREAKEEAGIDLDPKQLMLRHVIHRKAPDREQVSLFFSTPTYSGEIQNMEPHKCSELAFFDLNTLPENTIIYVKDAIQHVQQGRSYSEFGWGEAA